MDNPKSYPQTRVYEDTTDSCGEYKESSKKDDFNKKCGIRLEQYLWHDALHPTTAVHDAMAAVIAGMLQLGLHVGVDKGS